MCPTPPAGFPGKLNKKLGAMRTARGNQPRAEQRDKDFCVILEQMTDKAPLFKMVLQFIVRPDFYSHRKSNIKKSGDVL